MPPGKQTGDPKRPAIWWRPREPRKKAAVALGVAPSTIDRLPNDGIIAGEQLTLSAPWRIRLTDELKARFNGEAADGFLLMRETTRALGVSRQTVLQRVKRGELEAVHVTRGKQKGLRNQNRSPAIQPLRSHRMNQGYYETTSNSPRISNSST